MRFINLANNKGTAIVDDEDFEMLSNYSWRILKSLKSRISYAATMRKRHNILMHRLILGLKHGDKTEGDHWNGNGLDNRKCNLRSCTQKQNLANSAPHYYKTYKGIKYDDRNSRRKWTAKIFINGKSHYLGAYINKNDAIDAYDNAKLKHFGQFARLNSI